MREDYVDEWYKSPYTFDINKNLKEREFFGREIKFQSPQVLAFEAYYLEPTEASTEYNIVVHHCKIYFFLEDGTIKVIEPKNPYQDGLASGCIINRQRIRYPNEAVNDFYDILDLNIGNNVEFFGKVFKIIDCDEFTRKFLNRLGICVPDRMPAPEDPYSKHVQEKQKKKSIPISLNKRKTLEEYLSDDDRRLTFYAYWDDKENENGFVHLLLVYYYIVDCTVEIKDVTDKENVINVLKRGKLPMDAQYKYEGPGINEPHTVLNALGQTQALRYILDPLDIGRDNRPYYTDKDLRIGAIITAFGRKMIIYDCDNFTQEYYKTKYGLERHEPLSRPETREEELAKLDTKVTITIPPHNGFGSYEDSLGNCLKVVNFNDIVRPDKKFLEKDKIGYDSKILRFLSEMMIKDQPTDKIFVMSYYLKDDMISVYEIEKPNSGAKAGMFIGKRAILKPNERLVNTRAPEIYTYNDLYIGNTVCFDEFYFRIIGSDEYSLRYMETHPNEFPKSNINIIINKVKESIKPVFKNFVACFLTSEDIPPASYDKFGAVIKDVMGDEITDHEIHTLARFYAITTPKEPFTLEMLRRYAHDELRKHFYHDFERLRECFLYYDSKKCGYVSRNEAYTIMRGSRIPLDVEFIRVLLEKFGKDENCNIVYDELLHFLNYNCEPLSKHIEPINIPATMAWLQMSKPEAKSKVSYVDVDKLIKDFDLEKGLVNQCR